MRLNRLILENVCQHRHLDWEFAPGLNGIFGVNGAGKSNALKMAYASLTNDFTVNDGSKSDNIGLYASPTDRSYVETLWEHGSTQFIIRRGLQPDSHYMTINGGKPLQKATDIAAAVRDILGVPLALIGDQVFVQQGEMTRWLKASVSERAHNYMKRCGTDVAEAIWEALGKEAPPVVELGSESSDKLKERRDTLRQSVQGMSNKLRALSAQCARQKQAAETAKETLEQAASWAVYDAQYKKVQITTANYQSQLHEARKSIHDLTINQQSLMLDYEELNEQGVKLKQRADAYKASLKQQEELKRLEVAIEHYQAQALMVNDHLLHDRDEDYDALKKELTIVEAEMWKLDDIVKLLESEEIVDCPTCHQELPGDSVFLDSRKMELDTASKRFEELNDLVEDITYARTQCELAVRAAANATSKLQVYVEQRDKLKTQLAGIVPLTEAEISCLDQYDKVVDSLHDVEMLLVEWEQSLKVAERGLEAVRTALPDRPTYPKPPEDQVQVAKTAAEAVAVSDRQAMELHFKLQTSQKELAQLDKQIERTEHIERKARNTQTWMNRLHVLRNLFHRNNLPKIVHERFHQYWLNVTNNNLEDFGDPFLLEPAESLGYSVRQKDGSLVRGARLSGGQFGVLAIAGLLARNSIFASQLGMLVLDEPTDGLDESNVGYLGQALQNLSRFARGSDRQVIIVTHDMALKPSFDKVLTA